MVKQIRIFGAALDPLDSIERINLKQAYLHYLKEETSVEEGFVDPYDFVRSLTGQNVMNGHIEWLGKTSIPTWLTPKPKESDSSRLSVRNLGKFLEKDGCWDYAVKVADYIGREIWPAIPVMIGVDHSLTGGPIMALAEKHPHLNVVILDAHFDVMSPERGDKANCQKDYYGCGNFLERLLRRGVIRPGNLWIIGVQDEIRWEVMGGEVSGRRLGRSAASVKKWMEKGVHIVFKHEAQFGRFKLDFNGPAYLSIDLDVGSMSAIYSARFMNSFGLNAVEFLRILQKVSRSIHSGHHPLVGLDVMECDVHFLEAIHKRKIDDRTGEIVKEIFRLFINENRCEYLS